MRMDYTDEPNHSKFSSIYSRDKSTLIQRLNQVATLDTLEIAASALGENNITEFESLQALPNTDSTYREVYGTSYLLLIENIVPERFNPSDDYVFITTAQGVFTRSQSDYEGALEANRSKILESYLDAFNDSVPVMAIPQYFEAINQYIEEFEQDNDL